MQRVVILGGENPERGEGIADLLDRSTKERYRGCAMARGLLFATVVVIASCNLVKVQRQLAGPHETATLDARSPYLKAHLRNGFVYVLSNWRADTAGAVMSGSGELLDLNRNLVDSGDFRVPLDSVALFETNVLRANSARTALTVMAGITAAVAAACLTDPKACFGSCPTFYTDDVLAAEGFSASIAPALEATDLDMLARARPRSRDFTLRLTNEALETHVIRWADLIVVPKHDRVFVTPDGEFRDASNLIAPSRCSAADGDCRAALTQLDSRERFSLADSNDLGTRETIDLEFPATRADSLGVVVTARQTLLTTFLIYQSLAYLGHEASAFLAALETRPGIRQQSAGIGALLGRIEVLVPGATGEWVVAGVLGETGPLASDTKVVPLPRGTAAGKIRLRLTRGLWRIDYVALATLGSVLVPERLPPVRVRRDGADDPVALAALRDRARVLTTLPGDRYELIYRLPPNPARYELFLEARGYYLEWMRREWLAEESRADALALLLDPAGALRRLAPAFKRVEPDIEGMFWNSRYETR